MDRAIRLMSCNDPFPALSSPPTGAVNLYPRAIFKDLVKRRDFLRERALPNFLAPEDWTSVQSRLWANIRIIVAHNPGFSYNWLPFIVRLNSGLSRAR